MSARRVEHLADGVTLYLGDCREILPIDDPPPRAEQMGLGLP